MKKTITTIALILSASVMGFAQGNQEMILDIIFSKHQNFEEGMNQLNKKLFKNKWFTDEDFSDAGKKSKQFLIEKSAVKPILGTDGDMKTIHKKLIKQYQKGSKKGKGVTDLSVNYRIYRPDPKQKGSKSFETYGELLVKTVKNEKDKRNTSVVKNNVMMTWKAERKGSKYKVLLASIKADSTKIFPSEMELMQSRGDSLVREYYRHLQNREPFDALRAPLVQDEFTDKKSPVLFKKMFDRQIQVEEDFTVEKNEIDPKRGVIRQTIARNAYFDEDQNSGNRLSIAFSLVFDKELNAHIEKVELVKGGTLKEETVAAPAPAVSDNSDLQLAKDLANDFLKKLARYVNGGAMDKALREELEGMFEDKNVIIEITKLGSKSRNDRKVKDYFMLLTDRVQKTYGKKVEFDAAEPSEPTLFGNAVEINFSQTFNGVRVYCDNTSKTLRIEKNKDGKYVITKISVDIDSTKKCP